jgi:succinate dehydrogenase / fumarate reductase cytochrome b subunit
MPELAAKKKRPRWYNLNPLNLPAPGLVSIFNRISGALLFLGLIWLLYLLDTSLSSQAGFDRARSYLDHPLVKLPLLVLLWSYLHHFCAGVRYLLLDVNLGQDIVTARKTGYVVFAVSLTLTVLLGLKLW